MKKIKKYIKVNNIRSNYIYSGYISEPTKTLNQYNDQNQKLNEQISQEKRNKRRIS